MIISKNIYIYFAVFFLLTSMTSIRVFSYSQPLVYSAPIVITAGGTYQGNWFSDNPDIPAIKISTTEPVTIVNSNIKSKNDIIVGGVNDINLTIRNCNAYSIHPGIAGRYMGKFIIISEPKNLVVENNYLDHTNGIYVHRFAGAGTSEETIRIRYNSIVNLDGRQTTDSSFSNDFELMDWDPNLKIVQLNKVFNIENAEIAWNQVINYPFYSSMQDGINIYDSSGTASSPIKIHNNYIQGAYSGDPAFNPNYGVGIICDGSYTPDPNKATSYIDIYSNQVIANSNAGISIAAGHNNNLYNNRVVSAGFLPDGQWIKAQNVGMYIWNHYGVSYFASNNAWGNISGCNTKNASGNIVNNPYWFPDAGSNTTNNSSIQGQITTATEQNEYQIWLSKLSASQITIGSDNMPQLGQTGKVINKETFGYDDNTKLNTTIASGNWTTGWVQNTTVAQPTPLPDTYVVSPTWQVNLNDKDMYRGTSQIAIDGEYDYFFRWEQSLNSSILSPSIGADLRLVAYDTNVNTAFGMKSLSGTSQGQYIPFFALQGGNNNGGNSSIILNNNTMYTIVGRLSSRNNGSGVHSATGSMMAYESGTAQPGNWMTETYSASGINYWQFQAVGFSGRTYNPSESAIFKGLTVEKYTKAEIEPIETAVNLALSTRVYSDVEEARSQVATLIDGIAKETLTAKLNTLTNTLYIGKAIFSIDEGTENDVINVNTMISNNDIIAREVTIILALYYNNQLKQIVATPSEHALISAGAVVQRELSLVVPKISEGYKIKYLVWDDLTTLKPYESKVEQLVFR